MFVNTLYDPGTPLDSDASDVSEAVSHGLGLASSGSCEGKAISTFWRISCWILLQLRDNSSERVHSYFNKIVSVVHKASWAVHSWFADMDFEELDGPVLNPDFNLLKHKTPMG